MGLVTQELYSRTETISQRTPLLQHPHPPPPFPVWNTRDVMDCRWETEHTDWSAKRDMEVGKHRSPRASSRLFPLIDLLSDKWQNIHCFQVAVSPWDWARREADVKGNPRITTPQIQQTCPLSNPFSGLSLGQESKCWRGRRWMENPNTADFTTHFQQRLFALSYKSKQQQRPLGSHFNCLRRRKPRAHCSRGPLGRPCPRAGVWLVSQPEPSPDFWARRHQCNGTLCNTYCIWPN